MRIVTLIVALFLVGGCAGPQPVLAPSSKLQETGSAQAQSDIRECMEQADRSAPLSGAERAAQDAASIPGRMAGATQLPGGEVIAGPPRPTASAPTASPAWKAAVERCLAERGHTVERWK